MLFNKNDKIGSYTVLFQCKQGYYTETYRVKDIAGRTCFLKLINYNRLNPNQIADNGQVLEVEIAKQLRHHNLCNNIDSGDIVIDGAQYTYIITEYISGETISQKIIRDGDLGVYEIKQIAKAVLSALCYLHTQSVPIVHGEVTIQNVLLSLVGDLKDLKLIDFGHVRYLNQIPVKPDLNDLNVFYLAPECFSGISQIQSDLYSVGVMMYQLLYGEYPWFVDISCINESDKVDVILAERDKSLDIPEKDIFEFDNHLVNCIIKALSYDVNNRFQTADDFIKAIDGEIEIERQSTRGKTLPTDTQDTKKKEFVATVSKGKGFSAIAGMEELKGRLKEEVIEPLHNPKEYEKYSVTIPNGMLLYGPPGCGKTFFAKHFAEEVGFNFMFVTPATLKSRYVNATQENIAKMFQEAEEKAPTIIFIDEMNELVPNRESEVHEMSRSAVNEMLAQMDRTGERGIFIIGATNYPHMIDPAMLRSGRLDKKYYIGVPDKKAREALFRLQLEKRPYDFGIDYEELAQLTENYVSSDIQLIVNDASRTALKAHSKISMSILKHEIKNCRPSLNTDELKRYDEIRAKMNGEYSNKQSNNRPQVGFR